MSAAISLQLPPFQSSDDASLTQRARMLSARAQANALLKAEKKDPTEMPKPLLVEQLLSARVRYLGTAERADKYVKNAEAAKKAAEAGTGQPPYADQSRAELARQKLAEAKALEAAEKERPTEMPKPLIVEQLLSARIRYVGTANRSEKYIKRKMEESEEAKESAAEQSAVEEQIRAREEAVVRMQSVHRGKSARSELNEKTKSATMKEGNNEMGKQVDNFFGWVAQLGQQQKDQPQRPSASATGDVRQQV